ncbi:MAG: DNA (cytosine-5-)-methyltransferase, partial [Alphaproteobacteria bacterium]|nr:DNA (cytosine-5-)-methyltransferase [Alphaproteobacteria bacterium]
MEAPIVALRQLKIPFSHEFSSEIDKHCISTIRANFNPKIIFGDMTTRDIRQVPDIDLYVCGFPCQPFSMAGKRQGEQDPRGTVFYECLRVIKNKKPMIFILENVIGLLSIDGGKTFKTILRELERL